LVGSGAFVAAAHHQTAAAVGAISANGDKVLRVAFPIAETGFDPPQVQDQYSRTVIGHIFEAPLVYDYLARPASLRPRTAAELPVLAADGRSMLIRISPDIYFQDDPAFKGQPRELVAADYVYSWKRLYDPRWKSPTLYLLENARLLGLSELRAAALKTKRPFDYDSHVDGLHALDRYTLQLRFAVANPRFIYNLTDSGALGAVAREVVEAYGDDIAAHPVGTGPFRLTQWRRSSRIVLERNPGFRKVVYDFAAPADAQDLAPEAARLRGRRLPLVDQVEISIIEESQPRWLAFMRGDIDLFAVPNDFMPLAAPNGRRAPFLARRGVRLRLTPMSDITMSYFSMDDPVVGGYTPEKVALRRAVGLSFNRDEYLRLLYGGQGVIAQSPIAPGTFSYDPELVTEAGEYNPVRAQALLDTYGYVDRDGDGWREQPDGSLLELEIASTPSQLDRKHNEVWRRSLDAIGVRSKFRIAPWPELLKLSTAGKLMIWGYGWQLGEPDSDTIVGMAYGPNKAQTNDSHFDLAAFNRLYEKQRALPDGPERKALLLEATRLMVAYMPYLLHMHRVIADLVQPWVIGYRRHPLTTAVWSYVDIDDKLRRELLA
jgi:ABC-type transport system substrate-binding protein